MNKNDLISLTKDLLKSFNGVLDGKLLLTLPEGKERTKRHIKIALEHLDELREKWQ